MIDPVCENNINAKEAWKDELFIDRDNVTFYFCSEDCKNEFDNSS